MFRKTIICTVLATMAVLLGATGLEAGCGLGKRRHSAGFYYSSPVSYSAGSGCVGYSAGCVGFQASASQGAGCLGVAAGGCYGQPSAVFYGSGCQGGHGGGLISRIRDRRAARHSVAYFIPVQPQSQPAASMPKAARAADCQCGPDCKCVDCVCGPDKVSQATTSDGKVISPPVYRWCDPVTGQCHLVQLR